MKSTIVAVGKTDIGRRRSSNQDQFLIGEAFPAFCMGANSLGVEPTSLITQKPQASILIVADGMGGHQGGSRAAELSIRLIASQVCDFHDWHKVLDSSQESELRSILQGMVDQAHHAVLGESRRDAKLRGMGTTLTIAILVDFEMWITHVGDSRCYRIRGGEISKLTRDHTIADQIASRGGINPSFLDRSPWSNVLWNAIGADAENVKADIAHHKLEIGDRYVLCSDGLNKHLEDSEILQVMNEQTSPQLACDKLVDTAVELGGTDNVTVIVFEVLPMKEQAEGMGFEPTTGFPAPDFESGS